MLGHLQFDYLQRFHLHAPTSSNNVNKRTADVHTILTALTYIGATLATRVTILRYGLARMTPTFKRKYIIYVSKMTFEVT